MIGRDWDQGVGMRNWCRFVRVVLGVCAGLALSIGSAAAAKPNPPGGPEVAIAAAGVYTASDFPSGWVATKPSSTSTTDEAIANIKTCKQLNVARAAAKKAPGKESMDFTQQTNKAGSTVRVFSTPAAATKIYNAYTSTPSLNCLATAAKIAGEAALLKSNATSQYSVDVTLGQITGPSLGDRSTRSQLQIVATPKSGSFQQKAYLDLVFVLAGRAVGIYQYQHDFNDSTSQDLPNQLIDTAVRRLTAALAGQPVTAANAPAALGTTATAGDGAQVTVYSYQPNIPGKFSSTPQDVGGGPGATFAAVDAQLCAPQGATTRFSGNEFNFKLTFPDNTSAQPNSSQKDPQLNANNLGAGQCARGFVGFVVPPNETPGAIVYAANEGRPLQWKTS
jgi:hypothetical protein